MRWCPLQFAICGIKRVVVPAPQCHTDSKYQQGRPRRGVRDIDSLESGWKFEVFPAMPIDAMPAIAHPSYMHSSLHSTYVQGWCESTGRTPTSPAGAHPPGVKSETGAKVRQRSVYGKDDTPSSKMYDGPYRYVVSPPSAHMPSLQVEEI